MVWDEKRAWLYLVTTSATFAGYVVVVLGRSEGDVTGVAYAWPMVISILVSIAASVVLSVLAAVLDPAQADRRDERDDVIARDCAVVGGHVTAVFMLGVLAAVMAGKEHFWIGNGIYLAFFIGSTVEAIMKVVRYRRGF